MTATIIITYLIMYFSLGITFGFLDELHTYLKWSLLFACVAYLAIMPMIYLSEVSSAFTWMFIPHIIIFLFGSYVGKGMCRDFKKEFKIKW